MVDADADALGGAVAAVAEETAGAQREAAAREVTLSTGVVLEIGPVPDAAFLRLGRKFKPPRVPTWRNPDKGRDEENPDDPEYLRQMTQYRMDLGTAQINTLVLLGTRRVVSVPDGVPGPDDPAWLEERELLGLSSGDSPSARLLDWLLLRAAPARGDLRRLTQAIGRLTGTSEDDVAEALKSAGREQGG